MQQRGWLALPPDEMQERLSTSPSELARRLLDWYRAGHRDLPWRHSADPYRVWVAEVMLQQTRVEAVIPYYERFLQFYPTVDALAAAPREEVLANWSGLGYYRRARNLHDAAKRLASEFGGRLPSGHGAILSLPGIGEYTAAAIASIAFDQPRAALDGNGLRVLARFTDDWRDIREAACKRSLKALAGSLMETVPAGQRGTFTQALIELGATVCIPRAPRCPDCPWNAACVGLAAGSAAELPVKGPRRAPARLELSVFVARRGDLVLARQRPAGASIMPGFWELPTVKGSVDESPRLGPAALRGVTRLGAFSHTITSTNHLCQVYGARLDGTRPPGCQWVPLAHLRRLPVSTISRKALRLAEGNPC